MIYTLVVMLSFAFLCNSDYEQSFGCILKPYDASYRQEFRNIQPNQPPCVLVRATKSHASFASTMPSTISLKLLIPSCTLVVQRCLGRSMSQKHAYSLDINTQLQKPCGKAVAQRMEVDSCDAQLFHKSLKTALNGTRFCGNS